MIDWHLVLPKLGYWLKTGDKSLTWKGGKYVQSSLWHKNFNPINYTRQMYQTCQQTGLLIGTIECSWNPFSYPVSVLHSEN